MYNNFMNNETLKTFQFQDVSVDSLKPHPKNYRKHPEDQIKHLIKSIEQHGLYRNVVISSDGIILIGHGIVQAVKQMGIKDIPAIRINVTHDSIQALKLLAGDNEIGHLAEVDDRMLTNILKEIKIGDVDGLLGTGFDDMMLANLVFVSRPASEIRTMDEAAEWVGMPEFITGMTKYSIIVHFENLGDKEKFAKLIGQKITEKKKFIWFPEKERDDLSSVKFEPK